MMRVSRWWVRWGRRAAAGGRSVAGKAGADAAAAECEERELDAETQSSRRRKDKCEERRLNAETRSSQRWKDKFTSAGLKSRRYIGAGRGWVAGARCAGAAGGRSVAGKAGADAAAAECEERELNADASRGPLSSRGSLGSRRWKDKCKSTGLKTRRYILGALALGRKDKCESTGLKIGHYVLGAGMASKSTGLKTRRYIGVVVLVGVLGVFVPMRAVGQEVALEKCDALPVIEVRVAGQATTFLVDTAATSMLNLKSFSGGKARDIRVSSWHGTLATSAKEISLGEMVVGDTKLIGLELPAIDLSAIGEACGRKIDGILGVDLIAKLGITIDLKKQMLHVRTADEERAAKLTAEMMQAMQGCLGAFNSSDEKEFGECLDPKIVLFTMKMELYGREQVLGFFRDKYFHQQPGAKLELNEMAFHPVGEAVWYEYEFTIESSLGLLRGKGMAMCRKTDGRWRMASMHHTNESLEPVVARERSAAGSER